MKYARLWKGIRPRRITRDPRLWLRYLCWWANFNLEQLPPLPPMWAYRLAGRITSAAVAPYGAPKGADILRRVHAASQDWIRRKLCRPLVACRGPFDHRCAWTDPDNGLLYGGDGREMDKLWAQFVENISPTPEQEAAMALAAADLHDNLYGRDMGDIN